jgi:uncharacterized protein
LAQSVFYEPFDGPILAPGLAWYCSPAHWSIQDSALVVAPDAGTDYWQRTHYGFRADNGHFLYLVVEGDFVLSTRVRFRPVHQYDQAGLMVRLSSQFWIKTSVEYEPDEPDRLGAVVTSHGFSDWSTQNAPAGLGELELRLRRRKDDYTIEYLDGGCWTQIRMAHLDNPNRLPIQAGIYACSPKGAGFRAEFDFLRVERVE